MNGDISIPWRHGAYFSTGRDALCALLAAVCTRPTWRRFWLPAYYCPDVVRTLLSLAPALLLELRTYPAPPPSPPDLTRIPLAPGDLLLLVDLFGLHGAPPLAARGTPAPVPASAIADRGRRFRARTLPPGVALIEDHTHDPLSLWARTSTADWCFASLRKTLPLPDGGVLWSPGGRSLPRPPALTLQRRLASLEMLAAMTLRRAQIGAGVPETIRELELKAEARLQSGAVSGMPPWTREMLEDLPVAEIRRRRLDAHQQLAAALDATDQAADVRLLRPAAVQAGGGPGPADACPYPAILEFAQPAARRRARRLLDDAGVETIVLWPQERQALPGAHSADELDFDGRMLAIVGLEERLAQRGPGEAARLAALLSGTAATATV